MTFFTARSKTYWIRRIKSFRDEFKGFLPLSLIKMESIEVDNETLSLFYRETSNFSVLREFKLRCANSRRLDTKWFLQHLVEIFKVLCWLKVHDFRHSLSFCLCTVLTCWMLRSILLKFVSDLLQNLGFPSTVHHKSLCCKLLCICSSTEEVKDFVNYQVFCENIRVWLEERQ